MIKPNIFKLATKELTQDSFFTWLLQWADNTYHDANPYLNQTAQDFVRLLIDQSDTYKVTKVDAGRQLQNIDIWAEVNDEYFLCIEDKTNTGVHSNQLDRYKELVLERYKGKHHILKFVYLKTGNESASTLRIIQQKDGYAVIDRKAILEMLHKRKIESDIFNDFLSYLTAIHELTALYTDLRVVNTQLRAAEGFYIKLQELLLPEWTDWKFVPNPNGGFLGFWYHWVKTEGFELYIQIENRINNDIQVNIRIGSWQQNIDTLNRICSELREIAPQYGLQVVKPSKYRLGNTSTLANVANAIPLSSTNIIDIQQFIINLRNLEALLDSYILGYNSNLQTN